MQLSKINMSELSKTKDTGPQDSIYLQNEAMFLSWTKQKLKEMIEVLLMECYNMEERMHVEEKRLLQQIQEKNRLILSLSKINDRLIKENAKMKKKFDGQFQYFRKRICETENRAMEEKNSMLKLFQSLSVEFKIPIFTSQEVKPKGNNILMKNLDVQLCGTKSQIFISSNKRGVSKNKIENCWDSCYSQARTPIKNLNGLLGLQLISQSSIYGNEIQKNKKDEK